MSITAKYSEAVEQINAITADKAKLEMVALELKDKLIALEQSHAAEIGKMNEQLAKMKADGETAEKLMTEAANAKAALEKQVAEKDEQIKALEAKIALAPVADVAPGCAPVADGAAPSGPATSHLENLAKLGKVTPEAVAYYRKHEKEIDAEIKSARK